MKPNILNIVHRHQNDIKAHLDLNSQIDWANLFGFVIIDITKVSPAEPEENQPIQVDYKITNYFLSKTLNGAIQLEVPLGETVNIAGLGYGASQSGSLRGLAPLAGQNVEIKVSYREYGAVEFVPIFEASGSININITARYELSVDWVKVVYPRAQHSDTLIGQCTALYGGEPVPNNAPQRTPFDTPSPTVTAVFGDHHAGDVVWTPTFKFGPISGVPGIAPDLVFNYLFTNSGYDQSHLAELEEAFNWLSRIGAAVASAAFPAFSGISPIVNGFHEWINNLLTASCDGVVAGDSFTIQSGKLGALTAGDDRSLSFVLKYEGTPSPAICGRASLYEVQWTIRRRSRDLEGHLAL